MSSHRRGPAVGVLLVLLVSAVLTAGGVAGPATGATVTQDDDGDANRTEARHANPDNRSQSGDLSQVRGWLAGRMGDVVVDCTEGIEVGNYDACEDMNRSYPSYLEKYVDVTGRTATGSDDRTAESFADAQKAQQNFTDSVREFRRTYREYRQARQVGDTDRARRLARELRRQQRNASATGDRLVRDYRVITNGTRANLTEPAATINETTENMSDTVAEIETDLFVETELTAELDDRRVSFTNPLVVSGTVETVNGTSVSEGRIVLRANGSRLATTPVEDGAYRLEHRPATLPTGERNLTVQFTTAPNSSNLPTRTSVHPTVAQVEPVVTIESAPAEVQFGESVRVTGRLAVNNVGAEGVPLVLEIGGERVALANTTGDGRVRFRTELPAAVPPGNRTVRVVQPATGRALAPARATARTTVAPTATDLSLSANATGGRQVTVNGTLSTADGEPAAGQSVAIHVGGVLVRTVTTGPEGQYRASVRAPEGVARSDGPTAVRAGFDGSGSNLESATATEQVVIAAGGGDGRGVSQWLDSASLFDLALVGGALLLVLLGAGWLAYDRDWLGGSPPAPGSLEEGSTATEAVGAGSESSPAPSERLLEAARGMEGDSPRRAIELAYAAVRDRYTSPDERALTHWEFYRTTGAGLDDDGRTALERVTELYERVRFAGASSTRDDAESAIDAARTLVDGPARTDGGEAEGSARSE